MTAEGSFGVERCKSYQDNIKLDRVDWFFFKTTKYIYCDFFKLGPGDHKFK